MLWWQDPGSDKRVLTLIDPLDGRDVWPEREFPAAAHACVVGETAVGVMQPDGRFVLMGLPEGRIITDVQLEAEPTLIDITVLASGGQYFLLTRSAAAEGANPLPLHPMPGCPPKPIWRGRVYAFDKHGKLQWPAPAAIENQFVLSDQPARLPVLTFACHMFLQKPNGQGEQRLSLLAIDKRNGRTAYKGQFSNNMGLLDINGDARTNSVDLVMQRDTVRLTFTDKPLPPPSAADGQPAQWQGSSGIQAFWNSIKGTLGDLLDGAGRKREK